MNLKKLILNILHVTISIKMKIEDFDFYYILLAEISYENILICDILHDTFIGAKPLRIIFDKVDGFIRDYGGTKYLVLFGPEKYDAILDRIRYFIKLKSGISYIVSHNYPIIKIESDDDLPLEKTLAVHNFAMLIKSVFNTNHNQYH